MSAHKVLVQLSKVYGWSKTHLQGHTYTSTRLLSHQSAGEPRTPLPRLNAFAATASPYVLWHQNFLCVADRAQAAYGRRTLNRPNPWSIRRTALIDRFSEASSKKHRPRPCNREPGLPPGAKLVPVIIPGMVRRVLSALGGYRKMQSATHLHGGDLALVNMILTTEGLGHPQLGVK